MEVRIDETMPIISEEYAPDRRIVLTSGDSAELLKGLPDESIKLVVTSPPYNLNKDYETNKALDSYLDELSPILAEVYRILHPEGSICWQVGNYIHGGEVYPLDIYYYSLFKSLGLKLRNRIIWHFGHGLHASKRFSGRYETIMWFTKSDTYTFELDSVRVDAKYPGKRHYKGLKKGEPSGNPKGKNPSDVWPQLKSEWESAFWEIPNVKANHPEKSIHPCQFPIELVERCVLALTNEDDWVVDPFCGVGSSLIAALIHNRRAVGFDKEADYVAAAKQRVADLYEGGLRKRPLGMPIHQPSGTVSRVPPEWNMEAAS